MTQSIRQATMTWIYLISLTLIAVIWGQFEIQPIWLVSAVMMTILLKGQQIVDVFMDLKCAPAVWRALLLSYAIVVPLITGIIFCIF